MVENKAGAPGRGSILQQTRLVCGLFLFTFAFFHFLNHALGNISLAAMDWGQNVRYVVTGQPIFSVIFYSAMLLHVVLGLAKLAQRRTLRMPLWEAAQILFALLIPYVLIKHIFVTRGAATTYGSYISYQHELTALWPQDALWQSALLVLVWLHGCIGIHYWLRMKRWYPPLQTPLAIFATLLPLLALTGWISAARRLELSGLQKLNVTAAQKAHLLELSDLVQTLVYLIIGIVLLIILVRYLSGNFRRRITISYLDQKTVKAVPGPTLLEISRMKGVPHMSICGGRARCSTCRTLILSGQADLHSPSRTEEQVLRRIGASSNVRLACQIRPVTDMVVRPLMSSGKKMQTPGLADRYRWGIEQQVAVMFIDMRGFTSLSEGKLPFDVVFILNRYVDGMVKTVLKNNGMIDKVMGDGVMALFAVNSTFAAGARDALACIADLQAELDKVNEDLKGHLTAPLRIAIGLHGGTAILGRIGLDGQSGVASGLTALGDVVNVASRLEGVAKEENALAAVSKDLIATARVATQHPFPQRSVAIRGRNVPLDVVCLNAEIIQNMQSKPQKGI